VLKTRIGRLGVSAAFLTLVLAFPMGAAATITGGCTGTGNATSGGADLTTATEWHVKKDDVGGGSGQGPTAHNATVGAGALGLTIPIASANSVPGESEGSVSGVSASLFAVLGREFLVSGSADNGCSGSILIIIDDVDPLFTVLGGGGAALAVIFGLLVLRSMRGGRGIFKRILVLLYGAIGGLGGALAAEQFDVIDQTSLIGLGIVILAALLGFMTAGILGGGKKVLPPAMAPAAVGATAPGPVGDSLPPGGVGGGGPA